jgi:hypothetical protein
MSGETIRTRNDEWPGFLSEAVLGVVKDKLGFKKMTPVQVS